MEQVLFSVTCRGLSWIDGKEDDPQDLCSHGEVSVQVGNEVLSYFCCTSAAAMRMLRTLEEDHVVKDCMCGEQMLPCCGFEMYADETMEHVSISGCSNGVDYGIRHQDGEVILTTERGRQYAVRMDDYRREVLAFARQVQEFYSRCTEKELPQDDIERNGYLAFWNEWKRRMEYNG